MRELLTTVDVGKMAGLTAPAITAACHRGEIRAAVRTPGNQLLFTKEAAEEYVKQRLIRRQAHASE